MYRKNYNLNLGKYSLLVEKYSLFAAFVRFVAILGSGRRPEKTDFSRCHQDLKRHLGSDKYWQAGWEARTKVGTAMRVRMIAVLVGGAAIALNPLFIAAAPAQNATSRPPVQDALVKPIGKVVTAEGTITIEHTNAVVAQVSLGNRPANAKIGDPVYLGDVVQTKADGRVGIALADGTALNLSSNARIELNEFLYDPKGSSNSSFFTLAKGSFTFIAGNVAKTGDMKIDTPVATMGIRGTTPHVDILDDGTVKFSTLVEKGKNEVLEKYGPVTVTPNGGGSPSGSPPAQEDKKLNLQICKGC